MTDSTRRAYLRSAGLVVAAGLAGCTGPSGGGGEQTDGEGSAGGGRDRHDAIYEWLTETEVGGADDRYADSGNGLDDWRDRDAVTIEVGASGNGGAFAFAPSAVVVSTGTEVEWSWTGDGGAHNIVSQPDDQYGTTDHEFRSGGLREGSDVSYARTMDVSGVALYHCESHLSRGMKGGIIVD